MRIAINGLGRIGRNVVRVLFESERYSEVQLVGVNDLGSAEALAYLLQYDSTHGPSAFDVDWCEDAGQQALVIDGQRIPTWQEADAENLPWADLNVDLVLECSGVYRNRQAAQKHIDAGATAVLVGAPGTDELDCTVVYGVNHESITGQDRILSNASCTTNCVAPILQVLSDQVGIEAGLLTTIHSYSNNQSLIDTVHADARRGRSATQSLIPTASGALTALKQVLPEVGATIKGYSMRVPTVNVAAADLSLQLDRDVSAEEVNGWLRAAVENDPFGILDYNERPLVSIDFKHNSASSIFDATQTQSVGRMLKLVAWYDNEWGYSHRMLDVGQHWFQKHSTYQ
ncbi:MAG: type I glyceraldehyde-3-phosphate dehydrogenase [Gammaproteobacteria bacterium]|nr:MAG: type I glyceraldehyde-3-phosphate dehydrogenase [Gammaproteobacteria bacterium]